MNGEITGLNYYALFVTITHKDRLRCGCQKNVCLISSRLVHMLACPCVGLSTCQLVHFISLPTSLLVHMLACPYVGLSICSLVHLSEYLLACPYISMSICQHVHMLAWHSVCLSSLQCNCNKEKVLYEMRLRKEKKTDACIMITAMLYVLNTP